jgi:hypothetical protein
MLGAAILLMVVGIRALVPRLAVSGAVAIAVATPLIICTVFGTWPPRCWIFAASMAVGAWGLLNADLGLKHGDVAAFSLSLVLLVAWTIVSINSINGYLSKSQLTATGAAFIVLLLYWLLILSVLVRSGGTVFRGR